jgi:hypothetical protein
LANTYWIAGFTQTFLDTYNLEPTADCLTYFYRGFTHLPITIEEVKLRSPTGKSYWAVIKIDPDIKNKFRNKLIEHYNQEVDKEQILKEMALLLGIESLEEIPKVWFLRHDVDYSLDHALQLASDEAEHGIFSTYFLLPTASYFDYSTEFINKCKLLQDLGHDVGIHNNFITQCLTTDNEDLIAQVNQTNLKKLIEKPIKFFLKNGILIQGSSCHGHSTHYDKQYFNYEIWQEFDQNKNETLLYKPEMQCISLCDVGLDYEAYFLEYDAYLSDSGAGWAGMKYDKGQRKLFERSLQNASTNIKENIIRAFNEMPGGSCLQVLLHPIWWGKVTWSGDIPENTY